MMRMAKARRSAVMSMILRRRVTKEWKKTRSIMMMLTMNSTIRMKEMRKMRLRRTKMTGAKASMKNA